MVSGFYHTKELTLQRLIPCSEHCLDMLRQNIMCQGDTQLITMKWGHRQAVPLANQSSPHKCVNWGRLNTWAKDHSVDVLQPGLVVHPILGKLAPLPVSFKLHH